MYELLLVSLRAVQKMCHLLFVEILMSKMKLFKLALLLRLCKYTSKNSGRSLESNQTKLQKLKLQARFYCVCS